MAHIKTHIFSRFTIPIFRRVAAACCSRSHQNGVLTAQGRRELVFISWAAAVNLQFLRYI
uniref:Uncharacterized protein n=1 Tax=Hyaloperonospora arabidopsidis (strain Emoy2) TaxID=559515 RepID=M4BP24_HYAAE